MLWIAEEFRRLTGGEDLLQKINDNLAAIAQAVHKEHNMRKKDAVSAMLLSTAMDESEQKCKYLLYQIRNNKNLIVYDKIIIYILILFYAITCF